MASEMKKQSYGIYFTISRSLLNNANAYQRIDAHFSHLTVNAPTVSENWIKCSWLSAANIFLIRLMSDGGRPQYSTKSRLIDQDYVPLSARIFLQNNSIHSCLIRRWAETWETLDSVFILHSTSERNAIEQEAILYHVTIDVETSFMVEVQQKVFSICAVLILL